MVCQRHVAGERNCGMWSGEIGYRKLYSSLCRPLSISTCLCATRRKGFDVFPYPCGRVLLVGCNPCEKAYGGELISSRVIWAALA